jgi:hypothetical protein
VHQAEDFGMIARTNRGTKCTTIKLMDERASERV